jgi:hypothetical protein
MANSNSKVEDIVDQLIDVRKKRCFSEELVQARKECKTTIVRRNLEKIVNTMKQKSPPAHINEHLFSALLHGPDYPCIAIIDITHGIPVTVFPGGRKVRLYLKDIKTAENVVQEINQGFLSHNGYKACLGQSAGSPVVDVIQPPTATASIVEYVGASMILSSFFEGNKESDTIVYAYPTRLSDVRKVLEKGEREMKKSIGTDACKPKGLDIVRKDVSLPQGIATRHPEYIRLLTTNHFSPTSVIILDALYSLIETFSETHHQFWAFVQDRDLAFIVSHFAGIPLKTAYAYLHDKQSPGYSISEIFVGKYLGPRIGELGAYCEFANLVSGGDIFGSK